METQSLITVPSGITQKHITLVNMIVKNKDWHFIASVLEMKPRQAKNLRDELLRLFGRHLGWSYIVAAFTFLGYIELNSFYGV